MEELSDVELVERAQGSEPQARRAFAALVRRYERPLFNFILRAVRHRPLAEELFQETFLKALRALPGFRPTAEGASVRAWLYRIALNLCRDQARSTRFQSAHAASEELGEDMAHSGPTPEAMVSGEQQAQAVRDALEHLSQVQREVVVLFQYQGLSYPEIADILNIPLGTVKSRMHAALAALGQLLAARAPELNAGRESA